MAAEVITMDLSTATDVNTNPIVYSDTFGTGYYDLTDVWDSTYSDSGFCQFIYTNDARFMLSHLPSQNSYGGMSWEGFTLSRVAQDTANVFGCMAKGGMAGEGTPYVIGYYSDWVTQTQGLSSNIILFDQEYYPEFVYICQNSNTMEAIARGGVFNAHSFTQKDTLSLIISALNSMMEETQTMVYYLAVDGEMNSGWVKVPLNTLGQAAGLSFRMTTTDMGDFGANTPMYFALDALTINTDEPTSVQNISIPSHNCTKFVHNNQVYVRRGEQVYNMLGYQLR